MENVKSIPVLRQELTFREKERVKMAGKYTCKYCGTRNRLILTVEHKVPLSRGGTDEETNLCCSCVICNKLKGPLTEDEFISYLAALHELHALTKVQLTIEEPKLVFNPTHAPLFKP
jgi:5-methylcytosine-specific restriction endonuclease McrA